MASSAGADSPDRAGKTLELELGVCNVCCVHSFWPGKVFRLLVKQLINNEPLIREPPEGKAQLPLLLTHHRAVYFILSELCAWCGWSKGQDA